MATVKITTTLKATPKLSPSILNNYVTKEELESKGYVADVVKDGVYGRKSGEWVQIATSEVAQSQLYCYWLSFPASKFDDLYYCMVVYTPDNLGEVNDAVGVEAFLKLIEQGFFRVEKFYHESAPFDTWSRESVMLVKENTAVRVYKYPYSANVAEAECTLVENNQYYFTYGCKILKKTTLS